FSARGAKGRVPQLATSPIDWPAATRPPRPLRQFRRDDQKVATADRRLSTAIAGGYNILTWRGCSLFVFTRRGTTSPRRVFLWSDFTAVGSTPRRCRFSSALAWRRFN